MKILHSASLKNIELLPADYEAGITPADSVFALRLQTDYRYLMSMSSSQLLRNFRNEAGFNVFGTGTSGDVAWGGWESPDCQLRGHFTGHWLSATAKIYALTKDSSLKLRIDEVIAGLAECQQANGNGWVAAMPEKLFQRMSEGKAVWAPHYTVHKLFMGLIDVYRYASCDPAIKIADDFADWFYSWTAQFKTAQMEDILDYETGGMLEAWSDLLEITGKEKYRELLSRYDRKRLFDRLLNGEDVLSNRHANTTVPEALGAARAYEVTGDKRWKKIALAYWEQAVNKRGCYATGSANSLEVWVPPGAAFTDRLGTDTQEHCTQYNMVRLADYLFRWTGDKQYLDFIERSIYNSLLAQQHPETGVATYFLHLRAGARKLWTTPYNSFFCCNGTVTQAAPLYPEIAWYHNSDTVCLAQFVPSVFTVAIKDIPVKLTQRFIPETTARQHCTQDTDGCLQWTNRWTVEVHIEAESAVKFNLQIRLPWWIDGQYQASIDGKTVENKLDSDWFTVSCSKCKHIVRLSMPLKLTAETLPGNDQMVAFLHGPMVLAGLTAVERVLCGDVSEPNTMLRPWSMGCRDYWSPQLNCTRPPSWHTRSLDCGFELRPIYTIVDEPYTIYFPIKQRNS